MLLYHYCGNFSILSKVADKTINYMDLTSKTEIKNLLEKYNAKPEKYLGQHFLLSKRALRQMTEAAEIKKTDTIVEIGPGLGVLTQELAKIGARVIAIERDFLMIEMLKETLADYKNIKIIQADARQLSMQPSMSDSDSKSNSESDTEDFGNKLVINGEKNGYKIVANLPYNIATFLIRKWLEMENPPKIMVLTIQKEVARRICAAPPKMNLLAVSTQFYAIAKIVEYVPKEMFWPKPKVDAAIIKMVPKNLSAQAGKPPQKTRDAFFAVVKAGFSQPRKQLVGNLVKKLKIPREKLISIFKSLNIPEKARAENLRVEDWISLTLRLSDRRLSKYFSKP